MELSKLIDGLDPKNVRPVIEAVQALPNQRKKMMVVSMLFLALGRSRSAGCAGLRADNRHLE